MRELQSVLSELGAANQFGTVLDVEYLRDLVRQVSAAVENAPADAVTLFYSGPVQDNLHSAQVAQVLADSEPGRFITIDRTIVVELIFDQEFHYFPARPYFPAGLPS